MSEYRFEELDLSPEGIREISGLLTSVFGREAGLAFEFLQWEYNDNPVGRAVGFNAWMGDELAAHYVTQPIISVFEGEQIRGLLSLNTATHKHHRGKKLFTMLAEKTYESGLSQGYDFVVGVANANSTPGFVKNLGFELISPLDVKFGIGRHNSVIAEDYDYSRFWDKKSLTSRLSNPKLQYEILKQKEYSVIFAKAGKRGIHAILGTFLNDVLPDNISIKSKSKFSSINIWMGLDRQLRWQGRCYFNFPNRFKPSPLNLIFRDLTGKNRIPKPEQIRFMALDFDAY